MPDLTLRPVRHADLDLLRGWFAQPHVRVWWGMPEGELAAMRADLDGAAEASGFEMRLALVDGDPIGYVQDGPLPATEEPYLQGLEPGARAIDYLIGPPDRLRCGYGAAMLRARADALLAEGVPCIYVDPDAANAGSVGAARRADLAEVARHEADGETTLVFRLPAP
jgi:aminoglycoside 6'-N-acetyltransferase